MRARRARRRRIRRAGAVSLAIHAIALVLFVALAPVLRPQSQVERAEPSEVITIARAPRRTPEPARTRAPAVPVRVRPVPVPAPVAAAARPVPRETPLPTSAPTVRPVVPPHELARVTAAPARLRALPDAPVGAPKRAPRVVPPPSTVALGEGATGARAAGRARYSAAQLARIQSDLAASVAGNRGTTDPLRVAVAPEPVATPKAYGPAVGGMSDALRTARGLCDPIKSWEQDGYDYYFVACNVRFSDGMFERQPVPWPVRFKPGDDPYNGTAGRELPLAGPLPGWHLPADETMSPELREYAVAHGADL